MHWVSRALPPGVRHAAALRAIVTHARRADVVYSTGMFGRSSLGAFLARTPVVLKLTADPAFERARRRGLVSGEVGDFQLGGGGHRAAVLRAARNEAVRRAAHLVCPSAFMRELVISWGVPPERVTLLPNPAPRASDAGVYDVGDAPGARLRRAADRAEGPRRRARRDARARRTPRLADRRRRPGARASRGRGGRSRRVPRPAAAREVLGLLRAADASILTSAWENFPHGVVESLAVGTPVIATRTGGVAEVVHDGENGLLVEPGDTAAFVAAVRRYLDDPELPRAAARRGGAVGRATTAPTRSTDGSRRSSWRRRDEARALRRAEPLPRAALAEPAAEVGRARHASSTFASLASSPDAVPGRRDVPAAPALGARRAAASGSRCPRASGARLRAFQPDAIVAQSPFEAAAALRRAHGRAGDRRAARRLAHLRPPLRIAARGARSRRVADAVGTWAVRRAGEGARGLAVHGAARARGRPRAGRDVSRVHGPRRRSPRRRSRCPSEPVALFIGVLEPYKNIDGLAEAWRLARPNGGAAHRREGHAHRRRRSARPRRARDRGSPSSRPTRSSRALDESSALILPSRSEGMGRVVIEAQLRGRPVLGSNVGGIPDLVTDGVNGMLVRARRRSAIADGAACARRPRGARTARRATRARQASAGSSRPTSTRSAMRDARRRHEARRRHAARRPRRSGARCDRADAARARRARRRARRADARPRATASCRRTCASR